MAGAFLRRRSRPPGQARAHMAAVSIRFRVLVVMVVLGTAAVVSAQAGGVPEPDPYQPNITSPAPPAPDPYPSVGTTSAAAPAPASAPSASSSSTPTATPSGGSSATTAGTSSGGTAQHRQQQETPSARSMQPRTLPQFPPRIPERTRAKRPAASVVVRRSTGSGSLALGGLAVFALAVASGGLLILVRQADPWRART
jgi:hypothetical protein